MDKQDVKTIKNERESLNEAPSTAGIYIYRTGKEIVYIGKSVNIKARLISHWENAKIDNKEAAIIHSANSIDCIVTDSELNALIFESQLINKHKPKYNARWRDDKSYLYIKINWKDAFPKIFPVRRENHDSKSVYFGPFPSRVSIEELLREIRKVIPFCTQRQVGKQPCFYAKIGLCRPCPNVIAHCSDEELQKKLKKEYRVNIKQVIKILEGNTDPVLKGLYKELKKLTEEQKYEEALELRNKIQRLEHLVHDRLFSGDMVSGYNRSADSINALKEKLLEFFPELSDLNRIECYDISNFQQKEATASMVVFTEGLMDKKEYRRFRIKNPKLQSDFDMLDEVLRRRFNQKWQYPDLLVIDGGRPQIRRVLSVLEDIHITIPVIGIAKHPDRLVIGKKDLPTIRPPIQNLGFNLVRSIRDESHRFAKKYHVLIRSRKSFGMI